VRPLLAVPSRCPGTDVAAPRGAPAVGIIMLPELMDAAAARRVRTSGGCVALLKR
jgi:hypothetical protein